MKEKLEKIALKQMLIRIRDINFSISYTDNLDDIISDMTNEDFGDDERFPYFVHIWETGPVLGEYFIESNTKMKNKTIIELGSGTGVAGVLIGSTGARIIFTDYEELSLNLCKLNAVKNELKDFDTILADWRNFPKINEKIDYVVGADILYEKKQVEPLFNLTKQFVEDGIPFFISDPNRGYIDLYLELIKNSGLNSMVVYEKANSKTELRNVRVYKIYK